jgi:hypothetical protein
MKSRTHRYTQVVKPVQRPVNYKHSSRAFKPVLGGRTHTKANPNHGLSFNPGSSSFLDQQTRHTMESRLGHDFSKVRIHTSGPAAQAAQGLGTQAFTYGRDIAFRPGAYDPHSPQGQRLLMHELAHVVQQAEGTGGQLSTRDGSYQRLEQDAEQRLGQFQPSHRQFEEPRPLAEPTQPALQLYSVPGSLACTDVVDWLNSNSPYAPEWAQTSCNYSFNGGVRTTNRTLPDGSVEVHAKGNSGCTVTVDCPIDRPEWIPDARPNQAAEVRAWNSMLTTLTAHERQHRSIGNTWRGTLQSRFQAVDFTVTGSDLADATQKAVDQLSASQAQWGADAQAAQSAIDPFRGAVLTCP